MADVLVAVASNDGFYVNEHFGRAEKFYIFELKDQELVWLETRDVPPVCLGGIHDRQKLYEKAKLISDCGHLIVSRIGQTAADTVESLGIEVYELPGEIDEAADKLQKFIKLKELF